MSDIFLFQRLSVAIQRFNAVCFANIDVPQQPTQNEFVFFVRNLYRPPGMSNGCQKNYNKNYIIMLVLNVMQWKFQFADKIVCESDASYS